jgi:PhnB protein
MARKAVAKKKKKPSVVRKKLSQKTKKKVTKKVGVKRKKKVLAIPKGYHSITPYLIVNHAAKAIDFYKKVFGAKEVMRMEHKNGKVGHAELKIGDAKIMLADEYPEMGVHSPRAYGGSAVSIHLYVKDVDTTVAKAISAGAKLARPVENMFYGDRSGMIEDPYGHKWYVSTHVEDVSPATIRKRAEALFGK